MLDDCTREKKIKQFCVSIYLSILLGTKSTAENYAHSIDDEYAEGRNARGHFLSNFRRWFTRHIPLGTQRKIPIRHRVSFSINFVPLQLLDEKKNQFIFLITLFIHWYACSNEVIRRIDEYSTTLVVEHISSEHTGNYTCIATNVAGTERFTVPVTVNVPPKWILQPKDSNVQAGEDISLHCQADGYPTPVVTWRKCFKNVEISWLSVMSPLGRPSTAVIIRSS